MKIPLLLFLYHIQHKKDLNLNVIIPVIADIPQAKHIFKKHQLTVNLIELVSFENFVKCLVNISMKRKEDVKLIFFVLIYNEKKKRHMFCFTYSYLA